MGRNCLIILMIEASIRSDPSLRLGSRWYHAVKSYHLLELRTNLAAKALASFMKWNLRSFMVLPRSANMCSSQPTLYCQKVIQDEILCTKHFKLFSLEPPPRSSEQRQRRSWFTNSMSEEAGSSIVSSQRKKCTSKSYGNRNLWDLHCQRLPVMVPSCPFHPQFSWAEPSDHGSTCDRGIS